MKYVAGVMVCTVLLVLGCARLRVEGTKEPIKVDISMRLDIYQHIAKDIDDIENIVSGSSTKKDDKQSMMRYFLPNAYAEEGLSPEVEQAALSRKDRRPALVSWQEKGVLGENRLGLVELRSSGEGDVKALVEAENKDRMVIYSAIAKKNGVPIEEVQKPYALRLQEGAPAGTPIEVADASGNYVWKIK
jgi:uncharacterized protein YdbL (DUF1318 family)